MPRGRPRTINTHREVLYCDTDVLKFVRNNKASKRHRSDNETLRELFGINTETSKKIFGGK